MIFLKGQNNKNCPPGLLQGQRLNIAAAVFANAISQGLTVNELEMLSSFAQLVGEAISNIAAAEALCENDQQIFIED